MSLPQERHPNYRGGTHFKPELLAQYDNHDVSFAVWLASTERIVYGGHDCYVLQFNLHFMTRLSQRKQFRGAEFEVEVRPGSGFGDPEMMFVRPVSNSGLASNQRSSTSGRTANRSQEQSSSTTQSPRAKSHEPAGNSVGTALVQGMVLAPRTARWKVCEPPKTKHSGLQHVKLQAMVRCQGTFGIKVKDFRVKLGYWGWPWPNRLIRVISKDPIPESSTVQDDSTQTNAAERLSIPSVTPPNNSAEDIYQAQEETGTQYLDALNQESKQGAKNMHLQRSSLMSAASEKSTPPGDKHVQAYRDATRAPHLSPSPQTCLDSSTNFDRSDDLRSQVIKELMAVTDDGRRLPYTEGLQNPNERRINVRDQSRNVLDPKALNSTMSLLVAHLDSESDLLEAWLRRENLRKKAIQVYLDTASLEQSPGEHSKPSHVERNNTQQYRDDPEADSRHRHSAIIETPDGPEPKIRQQRKASSDKEAPTVAENRSVGRHLPTTEELRRVWTIYESEPAVSTAKPSEESGISWTRPKMVPPREEQLSPSRAWKQLNSSRREPVRHTSSGYAF